jgi:hypothetical protein
VNRDIDPLTQLRAVRTLQNGNTKRIAQLIEQKAAIDKELDAARAEQRLFAEMEARWSAASGHTAAVPLPHPGRDDHIESLRAHVEAVMHEKGIPLRIQDVFKLISDKGASAKYYSIRTVLSRGYERGMYNREGHYYSLIHDPPPPAHVLEAPPESEAEGIPIDEIEFDLEEFEEGGEGESG